MDKINSEKAIAYRNDSKTVESIGDSFFLIKGFEKTDYKNDYHFASSYKVR